MTIKFQKSVWTCKHLIKIMRKFQKVRLDVNTVYPHSLLLHIECHFTWMFRKKGKSWCKLFKKKKALQLDICSMLEANFTVLFCNVLRKLGFPLKMFSAFSGPSRAMHTTFVEVTSLNQRVPFLISFRA